MDSKKPNSTRVPQSRPADQSTKSRGKPAPKAMADRLTKRKPVAGLGTAAVDALREMREGAPARALREIRRKLDIASAVAYVCAATLRAQTADCDTEVALLLQRCCGDALFDQMQHISRLLGEDDAEAGDDNGGAP